MSIKRGLGEEAIIEGSNEVRLVDGELRQGINVAMSPETFEQYRNGLRCLRCHGVQDKAFPEVCNQVFRGADFEWRCGFRIKDDQLRFLENEHRGEHRYGPSDVEFDDEQEFWQPESGIYLPRGYNKEH